MNLVEAKVGDKLAVSRYGSVRLFTVTKVSDMLVTAKGDHGSEAKFLKRSGKLRGGDSFTHTHIATPQQIERYEILQALSDLESECKSILATANKLGAKGIHDLQYNMRVLFENSLTSRSL